MTRKEWRAVMVLAKLGRTVWALTDEDFGAGATHDTSDALVVAFLRRLLRESEVTPAQLSDAVAAVPGPEDGLCYPHLSLNDDTSATSQFASPEIL